MRWEMYDKYQPCGTGEDCSLFTRKIMDRIEIEIETHTHRLHILYSKYLQRTR